MKKRILQADIQPKTPLVKICCIGSVEEALIAVEYGARAVGLVGPMPSGPRGVSKSGKLWIGMEGGAVREFDGSRFVRIF